MICINCKEDVDPTLFTECPMGCGIEVCLECADDIKEGWDKKVAR